MNGMLRRRGLIGAAEKNKYTLLSAIHIPGGAWISTGIGAVGNTGDAYRFLTVSVALDQTESQVDIVDVHGNWWTGYGAKGGKWAGYVSSDYGYQLSSVAATTERITFKVGCEQDNRQIYVNGSFVLGGYNRDWRWPGTFCIGRNGAFTLYSGNVKTNSTVNRNFLPVLNNETGQCGLIDIVGQTAPYNDATFYGNSGSGTITPIY